LCGCDLPLIFLSVTVSLGIWLPWFLHISNHGSDSARDRYKNNILTQTVILALES
jgi:hypothetical protein